MPLPYIGVTGYMHRYEADHVLSRAPIGLSHLLMTGVLASYKTLHGEEPGQPGRYPHIHNIAALFPVHPRSLNLIHYNTRKTDDLADQLQQLVQWGGQWLSGFQLNIAWPPLEQLQSFKDAHPDMTLVLQIGKGAMRGYDFDHARIAERASGYHEVADYVLIDPSGGRGESFDVSHTTGMLQTLQGRMPNQGLVVAGGLSAATVHLLTPLDRVIPDLSCDAEGRLRTSKPEDRLILEAADAYIKTRMLQIVDSEPS